MRKTWLARLPIVLLRKETRLLTYGPAPLPPFGKTACTSAAYEPSLVVFVQGQKRINLGKTTYLCDESNFLLTSIDLPVVSQ